MLFYLFGASVLLLFGVQAQSEGEACVKNGVSAVCRNIRNCPSALTDIKNKRSPQNCGFVGFDPIVCCPDELNTSPQHVATTPPPSKRTTTEYIPQTYDYVENSPTGTGNSQNGECKPINATWTSPKTRQKAWNKCIEYQEKLVYPCEKVPTLVAEARSSYTRVDRCGHIADDLIVGGEDAKKKEFPHMVLLGYGDQVNTAQWKCGGTLISEWFILTAGHCTSDRDGGIVTFAILGALKRTDQVDASRVYTIKRITKHPEYNKVKSSKYHDIALLETETKMTLDQFAVPACLDVHGAADPKASATGWGAIKNRGPNSDKLQKVTLTKFPTEECKDYFPPSRYLKQGFDANTQVCFGDRNRPKDTCQGDSGGPLQIINKQIQCMYTVIGVTSLGGACGVPGEPAIYTRVAHYVPWIESVVWPST